MSVEYTYIGHGCHLLNINGTKILIDPFLTGNPSTDLSPDKVEADVIVISHGHGDHVGDTVAIAQRTGAKVISNFEIINWLGGQGLDQSKLHPQHLGGSHEHEFGW
jgi:L-ascorbate metabolism protein UlaG (beta-lactamase superfamily)